MGMSVKDYDASGANQSPQQLSNIPSASHSSMEPLDLSRHSTTVPFVHPPTPDEKPNPAAIFLISRQNSMMERQMSVDYSYDEPKILIQPKSEWHYRNLRDLASKHIPLLSGHGPQRTPIRVAVPPKSDRPMYLAIQILTAAGEPHPSKVIVPVKTHVATTDRRHDNNLDCLDFTECNRNDYFNPVTRIIYSLITPEEHLNRYKDVRVYMFNLYQSQTITKELIESKQLHVCRLAFSLCHHENDRYQDVSQASLSNFIEEKRNTPAHSSPSMYVGHGSPDDMKENDNFGFLIIPIRQPPS